MITKTSSTSIARATPTTPTTPSTASEIIEGGGRSSARETTVRVAAGVVAKKLIHAAFGGEVVGYVKQVGDVIADVPDPAAVTLDQVEKLPDGQPNIVRCPDAKAAARMVALIEALRGQGDSIGGAAEIVATGVPPGLGEPVFDKIKADLAKALFSLPAVLGVEYGIGFGCVTMRGSQNNDAFRPASASANRVGPALRPKRIDTAACSVESRADFPLCSARRSSRRAACRSNSKR